MPELQPLEYDQAGGGGAMSAARSSRAEGPRVIVALDYAEAEAARALVGRLAPSQCRLKVGLELFTASGPALVAELADMGFDVFLDLKFHDIPNTVARACERAARLGVWMMNVHALGGPAMLRAARDVVERSAHRPLLVGVTLLTSHSRHELGQLGLTDDVDAEVERLAALAHEAGLDGVVCSAQEAPRLRTTFGVGFCLVTPGIRPSGVAAQDQSRVMTPHAAIQNGSDFLVVGRPVTQAADPAAALMAINAEIRA
jgi:orotidine-5'-phosphate decarboxylase